MKMKTVQMSGLIFFLTFIGCSKNSIENVEPTIQDIEFTNITSFAPDSIKTLESLKKKDELFVMTYYGDYNSRLEELNNRIITYGIASVIPQGGVKNECSIFAAMGNPQLPVFGRNLDNNSPRGVLIGLYNPQDGYSSIAVSNMYCLGFGRYDDPTLLPDKERLLLLNAVLFADDGINERGVSVALASVDAETIQRDENKKLVCISYIMREILDHAGSLDEAIEIVKNHDVFDQNINTISHHLLIADASGSSAVTEYHDGKWRIIRNNITWQIATNSRIYDMSEDWKRNSCSRYKSADNFLNSKNGTVSWHEGMNILEIMSVNNTQWSSIYDPVNRKVYISLYRKYNNILSAGL